MTQAVTARRDGDTFQARLFWSKAARLLDPESPITRVGFESGPKGFDDFWVEYDPNRAPRDQDGIPFSRQHVQSKWHVSPGSFGYADFAEPEFVNATARSLLQRAMAAQHAHAPEGRGARFQLVTNWRIDRSDPLRELVAARSHSLRLERLFDGTTDNSRMGGVRKAWREHLGIDHAGLRSLARTLAVSEATDSLDAVRENLDPLLRIGGLKRVPDNESAFIYDDVVFKWLGQGRVEFNRNTFQSVCESEGLVASRPPARRHVFGVKSFEHATDRLEDRCTSVLNLVPRFDDRQIRSQSEWAETLWPATANFLHEAAKTGETVRLVLDAHLSLSFAAGAVLNIKSGRAVEIEQRTIGRAVWSYDDLPPDPGWPAWTFDDEGLGTAGNDVAVAVGLTHDVAPAVRAYVSRALPKVGRMLVAKPTSGTGATAVRCGRHAFDLAETLTARIKSHRDGADAPPRVHLFVAGPGAFSFFLGQRQPALGRVSLYEFDFEGEHGGSYQTSLVFPMTSAADAP